MILTVFRSRLKGDILGEYEQFVSSTSRLAEQAPGFLGHKMFVAEDGERVTLVEFDSIENQRAWSLSAEHKAAAIAGRRGLYAEYRIQICTVIRDSKFVAAPSATPTTPSMARPRQPAEASATLGA
jgi:heme-degrading monooxygenase HmoA